MGQVRLCPFGLVDLDGLSNGGVTAIQEQILHSNYSSQKPDLPNMTGLKATMRLESQLGYK